MAYSGTEMIKSVHVFLIKAVNSFTLLNSGEILILSTIFLYLRVLLNQSAHAHVWSA